MKSAKSRHRPRLKNWARDGFATRRQKDFSALGEDETRGCREAIARVDCSELSPEEFARDFEAAKLPVIVKGVPDAEGWGARAWSYDRFFLDPSLSSLKMKCGEDDDGRTIRVTLKDFATYAAHDSMRDDSPLYIFDSGFSELAASGRRGRRVFGGVRAFVLRGSLSFGAPGARLPFFGSVASRESLART